MNRISVFVFLVYLNSCTHGQEVITKIHVNYSYDEDREHKGYDFKSDTLNSYLLFGSDFKSDSVLILIDDSIFYQNTLQTDYKYGYSDLVKMPLNGRISFKVNSMPATELTRVKGKNYITITYFREDKKIILEYSKYCPMIY